MYERYYTYIQFFIIVILTILSIICFVGIVNSFFKEKDRRSKLYLAALYISIGLFLILRICECVIPNLTFIFTLRGASNMLFFIVNASIMYYFYINFTKNHKFNTRSIYIIITAIVMFIALGCIVPQLIIKRYTFVHVIYTKPYVYAAGILTAIFVIGMIIKRPKKELIAPVVLYMIALFAFVVSGLFKMRVIDFFEYMVIVTVFVGVYLTRTTSAQIGISSRLFERIGDILPSYIIVVDLNGKIVFKNKAAVQSTFIQKKQNININNIANLFNGGSKVMQDDFEGECIEVKTQSKLVYFTSIISALKDNQTDVGYIITLTDITQLVELLNKRKLRNQELEKLNSDLNSYSKMVYTLEKDKQINMLMDGVLSERTQDMNKLNNMIEELTQSADHRHNKDFIGKIDETIKYNAAILERVRKTVTHFRQYYGGEL